MIFHRLGAELRNTIDSVCYTGRRQHSVSAMYCTTPVITRFTDRYSEARPGVLEAHLLLSFSLLSSGRMMDYQGVITSTKVMPALVVVVSTPCEVFRKQSTNQHLADYYLYHGDVTVSPFSR
jgi:hypothetical protein